jgi:hypothetical protein
MKPTGIFLFALIILLLVFACKKEYSYERGPEDLIASGYLGKKSGECAPATINGIYKSGIELGTDHSVTVQVYFTSPGKYEIVTDSQNGFSFAQSGTVTDTGYHSITLKPKGKPIESRKSTFSVRFDTSICFFSIPVFPEGIPSVSSPAALNSSDSAWKFTVENKTYQGFLDGASTHVLNGATIITLVGLTPTKDSAIAIIINMKGTPILTGNYKTPAEATFLFFGSNGTNIFSADKILPGVELSVAITKYDAANNIIEGSFSGTILNSANSIIPLTSGKFKAQLKK